MYEKINSVFILQVSIFNEVFLVVKWVNKYDKDVIREVYLVDNSVGCGGSIVFSVNGIIFFVVNGNECFFQLFFKLIL